MKPLENTSVCSESLLSPSVKISRNIKYILEMVKSSYNFTLKQLKYCSFCCCCCHSKVSINAPKYSYTYLEWNRILRHQIDNRRALHAIVNSNIT